MRGMGSVHGDIRLPHQGETHARASGPHLHYRGVAARYVDGAALGGQATLLAPLAGAGQCARTRLVLHARHVVPRGVELGRGAVQPACRRRGHALSVRRW